MMNERDMRTFLKTLGNIVTALITLYLITLLVLFVVPFLITRTEMRGLLRSVLVVLLFPSVGLWIICIFWRRLRRSILLTLPVIGLALVFAPRLLPRQHAAPADAPVITLLTFNLQTASDDLDVITDDLLKSNADVIGLQEFSIPASNYLSEKLADTYPYQALYPQEDAHKGQGIFSRYPILGQDYWQNHRLPVTLGHMWAQIDFNGTPIRVFSSHPVPAFSFEKGFELQAHSTAVQILLNRAQNVDVPIILMGDFNMTDQYDEYAEITASYTDTFLEASGVGFGFTFPAGNRKLPLPPVLRLDYVFHDDNFQGIAARTLDRSGSSDHLPLLAKLALVSK